MTDHRKSVLLDPQVPAPKSSSDDVPANEGWMWQTAFLLPHPPPTPKRETLRRNTIKSMGDTARQRVPEVQQHQTNLSTKFHYSNIW